MSFSTKNQKLLHFGHHFLTCPTFVPHSTFCVTALSILVHKKYINSWMCVWMSWYWYDMYDNPYDSYNRYIVILSHSSAPSYHNRSLCPYIMDRLHGKFLMGIQLWGNMVHYQSSLMRGRYSIMRKLEFRSFLKVK